MRKIADLRRSKRHVMEPSPESQTNMHVANDLIYRLAQYDRRLRTFLKGRGIVPAKACSILAPWKKSYERSVCYEGRALFDVDLEPFINLEVLEIVDSRAFDMSVICSTGIRRLVVSDVAKIKISGHLGGSLQEVVLRRMQMPYRHLKTILEMPSLLSVSLDSVEILECEDWRSQVLADIENMTGIRELRLSGMDIDPLGFRRLCELKNLSQFMVSNANAHVEAVLCGGGVSMLKTQNLLEHFVLPDLDVVESIYVRGSDIKHVSGMELPRLTSLYARQVVIDSNTLRSLYLRQPRLVELGFIECVFDHISFYEVIMHFRETLQHLNLRASNLPHDYVSFLQDRLLRCTVMLKNGDLKVIDNSGGVRRRLRMDV